MSIDVALITCYNEDGELLLGRRNDNGLWTLPGGHLDPGEMPKDGALRELKEETGLDAISLSYLTNFTSPEGVNLYCFSAFISGTPHSGLDPDNEVSEWKFFDVSDGLKSSVYNKLHGPKDVDGNLLKRLFNIKKAEDIQLAALSKASEIDNLLAHPIPAERRMALKLSNRSPEHVLTAALDSDRSVWQEAINHDSFRPEIGLKLMGANANSQGQFPEAQMEHVLANMPWINKDHLDKLYDNIDTHRPGNYVKLLNTIAQAPAVSPELWQKLYGNEDVSHENLMNILGHAGAPTEHLQDAIKNKDLIYRKRAIEHGNIQSDDVERLVRSAIGSENEELIDLACHALKSRAVSEKLINDLLNQAKLRPETNHAKLRLAALSGPSATEDQLDRGMDDPNEFVRNGVPFAPGAKPRHIDEAIDRAIKDKNKGGIKKLLEHPTINHCHLLRLLNKSEQLGEHNIAEAMLGAGFDGDALEAAHFLSGHHDLDLNQYRRYLIQEDGDYIAAALLTCGFEVNDSNIRALKSILEMPKLTKSEDLIPKPESITAMLPEGQAMAEAVTRAFKDKFVFAVSLAGKHSKGSIIARDESNHTSYLLKPGSGQISPALGVAECTASQSMREAAYYNCAKDVFGLDNWLTPTQAIDIDHKQYAAMELLPWSYVTIVKMNKTQPDVVKKALDLSISNGIAFQWGLLDAICGQADRHLNNCLINSDGNIRLIDAGSAFAGDSFRPGVDANTFTPGYLRYTINNFNKITIQERVARMPRCSEPIAKELEAWLDGLDINLLNEILERYGIDPEPEVKRLVSFKVANRSRPLDLIVNMFWAGFLI